MDVVDLAGMRRRSCPTATTSTGQGEQPTTTFEMFVNALLREIARTAATRR
jgi:hypothetical protein